MANRCDLSSSFEGARFQWKRARTSLQGESGATAEVAWRPAGRRRRQEGRCTVPPAILHGFLSPARPPQRATLHLLYTSLCTGELNATRKHKCFLCSPFYGRACRWAMVGEINPNGSEGGGHPASRSGPVPSLNAEGGLGRAVWREPGDSYAAYRVSHHGILGYGERRCGFNTKHQRITKATDPNKS